jgi:hypothetical protein
MADHYRLAAIELLAPGRRSDPLAQAPGRLLALQAIELYLNAWLREAGESVRQIRARQHDFAGRAEAALAGGLALRRRTLCHLARITASREYLVVRYDSEGIAAASQVNRLLATLDEIARKVRSAPVQPAASARPGRTPAPGIAAAPVWQRPPSPPPFGMDRPPL